MGHVVSKDGINTDAIDPKLVRMQGQAAEQKRQEQMQDMAEINIDNIGKLQSHDNNILELRKSLENSEEHSTGRVTILYSIERRQTEISHT